MLVREAEIQLRFYQRSLEIADQIRVAFRGVTLGDGVGLREGDGMDDNADEMTLALYRSADEKEKWDRILPSQLNEARCALSYFDPQGMRFHLPAYLIADLRGEYRFGMACELTGLGHPRRNQFELLNDEQRQSVRAFLLHILEDPDYRYEWDDIRAALVQDWTEGS